MKKNILLVTLLTVFLSFFGHPSATAQKRHSHSSAGKTVHVRSYTKKNGTHVRAYSRSRRSH